MAEKSKKGKSQPKSKAKGKEKPSKMKTVCYSAMAVIIILILSIFGDEFNKDEKYNVLLIDIREPEEIKKLCNTYGSVKTILIRRNSVKNITSNIADAGVFAYDYDFIIENNGTIDEFKNSVKNFVMENINV